MDDGDDDSAEWNGPFLRQRARSLRHLRRLVRAHRLHPRPHGRTVSLPSHPS